MATREQEIKEARQAKRQTIEQEHASAYPSDTKRTHTISEALDSFDALAEANTSITLAGRIMAIRGQGAILFARIDDPTGSIQIMLKKDEMPLDVFASFQSLVDIGDIIEITGALTTTQRGQQSIAPSAWRMLTKSLLPLPEKHQGIQDEELRFRKRYLDFLMDEEKRARFVRKSIFWDSVRSFLGEHNFISVETPTLETTTGGAEATPFGTHHNDFDLDVYLRISVGELWQKRLMASNFEKTYEIGRVWRNEGSSKEHLQEFTNCEFYMAYKNYEDGMTLVEDLYRSIAQKTYGTTTFTSHGHTYDLSGNWDRIEYVDEIKKQTNVDVENATTQELLDAIKQLNINYVGDSRGRLIDTLWKYCRKNISGPAFVIHHPTIISPLAKTLPNNPNRTERFQPILAGSELGNGFSELNDPEDQRKRFTQQHELLSAGDTEAMMPEWDFVEMLEHGMPPTCGFGFGERLFAFFEDISLREATLFPLVKPKTDA